MIFLLKYWRVGLVAVGTAAAIAFYFHYQGLRSELRETRTENARLADINEQNKAVMGRIIQDHEKALAELKAEREAAEAEIERLEDIERDALSESDGPLAGNLRRLFDRLRTSENDH